MGVPGGNPTTDIRERIRQSLLVDEHHAMDATLPLCKPHIQLDPTGRVHFKQLHALKHAERVLLFLVGKRMAKEAGLVETDVSTLDEVAEATGVQRNIVTARLSDLEKKRLVELSGRGSYRAVMANAPAALTAMGKKVGVGE